jgi:hypothetical protein
MKVRPPLQVLRTPERPCLCLRPRRMQQLPAGSLSELHLTPLFLLEGHHDCLLSNQRPGVARAPNQRSIDSQARSLDSHNHLRYWPRLLLSDLIAYSFQEPRPTAAREIKFTVPGPVPVRLARCLFCRLLPLFCSLLANIILPLGRTNSFSSRLVMIECPQRTGKQSQQP